MAVGDTGGTASSTASLTPLAGIMPPPSITAPSSGGFSATSRLVIQQPPRPSPTQTSIASGSQHRKGQQWTECVDPKDIRAWGLDISSGSKKKHKVIAEVVAKYGTPVPTAANWFSANGLTELGRTLMDPAASRQRRSTIRRPALSSQQLLELGQAHKSGTALPDALKSIDRVDLPHQTARNWLGQSSADGLSERGRKSCQVALANALSGSIAALDTQRRLFATEPVISQARLAELQNRLALYRALGGEQGPLPSP